jgi:hypothetical protein
MERLTAPNMAAELLKLLRGQWMTRHAIVQEMGLHRQRCNLCVEGLHANGLLIARPAAVRRGGFDVLEYTVAPAWMGVES